MRSVIENNTMRLLSITALIVIMVGSERRCVANDSSHQNVLNRIFDEDVLQNNVLHVLQKTSALELSARFEFLAAWVLPSELHSSIWLNGEFAKRTESPETNAAIALLDRQLQSPALELLDIAFKTGKLDELRTRVIDCRAIGEVQQRCRFALLAMIEIFDGNISESQVWIEELEARLETQTFPDLQDRWPETLMLTVAVEQSELHDVSNAILNRILSRQIRTGAHSGPPQWDRHIAALAGRLRFIQAGDQGTSQQKFQTTPHLINWIPVSECDEATRGLGFPQSHWQLSENQVDKLVSHQNDYLMYRIPLTGEYVVECDTTCFGFRETQLTIGGHWLSPHFTHELFETGDLRGLKSQLPLDPKLSLVNDWVRYRAVVKGNMCSTYLNGRLMLTESLRESQFPWIAIRSPFFSNGSVKNVCISGTPEILTTVLMSTDPELSGWARFQRDAGGASANDWRFDESLGPNGGIFARRKPEYNGSFQESLLRYFRPMAEDGVIEYEFFYEPGEFHVSPALDQQVYLIETDGIVLHQVTNGMYDVSGTDPLNRNVVQPRRICPLIEGWNRVRFELVGNSVLMTLNSESVYRGELDPANDRSFGLFHYADQSAVRVRNLTWTGQWPTKLPLRRHEELRSTELDEVDARVAELSSVVEYDFTEMIPGEQRDLTLQPYSKESFQFHAIDNHGSVEQTPGGLRMHLPGIQTFHNVWVAPRVQVTGDFDIVAEFAALEMGAPTDGTRSISLVVVTEDPRATHSGVWHGVYAHPGIDRRRATQVEFNRFAAGRDVTVEFEGVTAEACDSGQLRIARSGNRMFFMIAEQDSNAFRVIHDAEVAEEPLRLDGIRLAAGTWDNLSPESGDVEVLWRRLRIRTEDNQ